MGLPKWKRFLRRSFCSVVSLESEWMSITIPVVEDVNSFSIVRVLVVFKLREHREYRREYDEYHFCLLWRKGGVYTYLLRRVSDK